MVSTFLDIGSGFGKPNFHAALQVFPKESLGIEIVPARVCYCQDQMYSFEDRYKQYIKKEEANQKNIKSKDSSKEINTNNFGFPPTAETTH